MEDAERTPDRKLLPPGLGDTLIMTGAAMMAGTSPNAMTNIGQGLMQGMKYYQQQRNLDQEWKKNDAQIQNWQADARYKDAQTKLEARQLDLGMMKIKLGYKFAGMPLPAEFGGDGEFCIRRQRLPVPLHQPPRPPPYLLRQPQPLQARLPPQGASLSRSLQGRW